MSSTTDAADPQPTMSADATVDPAAVDPAAVEPAAVDLSIVIVTWNVWPLLRACLNSIAGLSSPDRAADSDDGWRVFGAAKYRLEVVVIDSAGSAATATDATATELPQQFPWVRYIPSERNLGFTGGNNLGYRASRGEFIFFLNPDTEFGAATTAHDHPLVALLQHLQSNPTVGMVGPQLRYGDGSWQNNRRHFPTRWTGFFESTWLGQRWPDNPWSRHLHMVDHPADRPHAVDWLNGSAMCCRRRALAAIAPSPAPGPFDERFFMYSEELDLCQRMVLAGWQIRYLPTVCITHHEGRSSEQVVVQRHIRFNTSKVRYYQKYFGSSWARLLRVYLQFEYLLQLLLETGKLLLRHKPQLRRERIHGYITILRRGFRLAAPVPISSIEEENAP